VSDVDLVQSIVEATEAAIRKREAAINDGARSLRGLVLDVEIANGGAVVETTLHLSWKTVRRAG
jgi:hypothetical protein